MFSTGQTPRGRRGGSKLLRSITSFFKKKKKQPYCEDVGEDEVCYGLLYLHSKSIHVMICVQQVREPCMVWSAELAEVSTTTRKL